MSHRMHRFPDSRRMDPRKQCFLYNKPGLTSAVDRPHEGGQVTPSEPSFSICKLGAVAILAHRIIGMKWKNGRNCHCQFWCYRTVWGRSFGTEVYRMLCRLRVLKSKLDNRLLLGIPQDSVLQEGSGPVFLTWSGLYHQMSYLFAFSYCSTATFFFSSHVWMWELDCKEGRMLKNWCFWTVVLEKTLRSPLDSKHPTSPS